MYRIGRGQGWTVRAVGLVVPRLVEPLRLRRGGADRRSRRGHRCRPWAFASVRVRVGRLSRRNSRGLGTTLEGTYPFLLGSPRFRAVLRGSFAALPERAATRRSPYGRPILGTHLRPEACLVRHARTVLRRPKVRPKIAPATGQPRARSPCDPLLEQPLGCPSVGGARVVPPHLDLCRRVLPAQMPPTRPRPILRRNPPVQTPRRRQRNRRRADPA